jgi:hypothetical protein
MKSTTPSTELLEHPGPNSEAVRSTPSDVRADARADVRAWLQERVDGPVCAAVAIAWFVLMNVAIALEPATSRAEPVIGVVLELATWLLLATMLTGFVMQRRFGLVASLGGAVLAVAESIACPISGHHQFGTWWFGQMACVLGLVAVSIVALRRQPSSASPSTA